MLFHSSFFFFLLLSSSLPLLLFSFLLSSFFFINFILFLFLSYFPFFSFSDPCLVSSSSSPHLNLEQDTTEVVGCRGVGLPPLQPQLQPLWRGWVMSSFPLFPSFCFLLFIYFFFREKLKFLKCWLEKRSEGSI